MFATCSSHAGVSQIYQKADTNLYGVGEREESVVIVVVHFIASWDVFMDGSELFSKSGRMKVIINTRSVNVIVSARRGW